MLHFQMPVCLQTTGSQVKRGNGGSPNLAASAVSPYPAGTLLWRHPGTRGGGSDLPEAGAASQTATPTAARDLKTAGELPDKRPLLQDPTYLGRAQPSWEVAQHKNLPCSAAWHPHASSRYARGIPR